MKCPNCGADVKGNSRFCEYCGSSITTQMLREQEQLNKAGCPKCGSTNITFNREKQGEVKGKRGTAVVRSTVGVCKDCGYTWQTDSGVTNPKKRKTWLWVLGWICIFPLPLTILLLRKKEIKPSVKYGIIAVAWIVYFIIGMSGNNGDTQTQVVEQNNVENQSVVVETISTSEVAKETEAKNETPEDVIIDFVDSFNANSKEQLVFVEDFTPSDKESGHYRTEFRLTAYAEAIGKSYSLGNATVDIVGNQTVFGEVEYRIYMNADSLEELINMVEIASPIMDKTLSSEELQKALDYLTENKYANGYYFGKLGIVLSGNELMLKND